MLLGGGWTYFTVVFVFGLVPLLDVPLGYELRNDPPRRSGPFRFVLYSHAVMQAFLLVSAACYVALGDATLLEKIGVTLCTGLSTGGIGITIAHELVHKTDPNDRFMGNAFLASVCYMHFAIEHVIGHHSRVGTPQDPATARRGETLYAFLPRTLIDSLRSAWDIEQRRIRKRGLSPLLDNKFLGIFGFPLIIAALAFETLGPAAVLFYFAQSAVAFTLLEIVNYVEHYGLERRELAPGRWEPVSPAHSWDADQRLTNWFLFRLQRHADHHMHPLRPYQTLRHVEDSPKLPLGYPGMVVLALVPPLWRAVMHPRLDAWRRME